MTKRKSFTNINLTKAYLIMGFLFSSIFSHGQDQRVADSLITVYNNQNLEGENLLNVLRGITEEATNPDIAIEYSDLLIKEATTINDNIWLYRGYLQKGNALKLKGDFSNAINNYFKSAEAAKSGDYIPGVGGALLTIGDTYSLNNDHRNGLKYRNQAIEILRATNDSVTLATALLNTGYEYYLTRKYDSSLLFYEESGLIFELKDFAIGKAYNLGNSGLVFARTGEIEKAEESITKAIDILRKFEDTYAITEFEIEIANIFHEKQNLQEAIKYANSAIDLAKKDGLNKRIRDASLKLSELYQATGEYQKAYTYQSQY
ncbi:MAG: adenylate/guanylate cyclase domain-containing protein, partial [bacterium]|nr:adenylate/guanylate cyclase domain-containing protein [bacterium]